MSNLVEALSKSKLFKLLDEFFNTTEFTSKGLKSDKISNETYGKKSFIYIYTDSLEERRNLERFLEKNKVNVNRNYDTKGTALEVEVGYFKGFHWDEGKMSKAKEFLNIVEDR